MKPLVNSLPLVSLAVLSLAALAQDNTAVVSLDSTFGGIVSPGAKVEKVAGNFGFTEGPVWVRKGGYLIFSDIPANVINRWNPADGKVSVFLEKTGFTGSDPTGVGGEQTNAQGRPST